MDNNWELAGRPDMIQVFGDGQRVLFFVLGEKPTPCYEMRITLGLEDIWPPIYNIEWRETGGPCADVVSGYFMVSCSEQQGPEHVNVRDVSGQQHVKVHSASARAIGGACQQAGSGA
jgi:hypothetical protein